jgi:hypothetical protein
MGELQDAHAYKAWIESLGRDAKLMRESLEPDKALYLEYVMADVKV